MEKSTIRLNIAKTSLLTIVDQGIVSVANFLTGIIIGRMCVKEQLGLYALSASVIFFVMGLQTSLIMTPYTTYSPRLKSITLALYKGSTLIHQLAFSVLIIVILAIAGTVLSYGVGPQEFIPVVRALMAAITFMLFWEYARRVCFADLEMQTALVMDCCVAILQVGGLLLLAHLGVLSASRAYWVIGIACGIPVAGWLIVTRKKIRVQWMQIISDLRQNLSLGQWIFASSILWSISSYLYPWILAAFHGTSAAAVWAACQGVVTFANPLYLSLMNFFSPKIVHAYAEGGIEGLRRFSWQAMAIFGLTLVPIVLIQLVFGGLLVTIIYGDKYAGNNLVVSILACVVLVSALTFSPSRALFTIERADVDFKINFLTLFILFSVGLWLVRTFGPVGAAIGLLLSNLASLILQLFAFSLLVHPHPGNKANNEHIPNASSG